MMTVSIPEQAMADALGDVNDDVRVIVWNPADSDPPERERDQISLACLSHYTGGRQVYARLALCPRLKVIQLPSSGFEHALPFVPPGVSLANARGVHDSRVAEMTVALALASRRRLPEFFDAQRRGEWEPIRFTPSLADSRALIVGYGSIGAAVGARLRALEVHVEGVGMSARMAPDGTQVHTAEGLSGLLPHFDIVIVVTPLTDQTRHMVDAKFLAAMPDGALLINVGRGQVVDTNALLVELLSGRLYAALDVTDPEPLPSGHPLWTAPHCIIVPHVAGGEALTNRRFVDLLRAQISALLRGEVPVNAVTFGAGAP